MGILLICQDKEDGERKKSRPPRSQPFNSFNSIAETRTIAVAHGYTRVLATSVSLNKCHNPGDLSSSVVFRFSVLLFVPFQDATLFLSCLYAS